MEMKWICRECGFVYDGDNFLLEASDYTCPLCERNKEVFDNRAYASEVETAVKELFDINVGKGK